MFECMSLYVNISAENSRNEYSERIESLRKAYALVGTNLKTHSKDHIYFKNWLRHLLLIQVVFHWRRSIVLYPSLTMCPWRIWSPPLLEQVLSPPHWWTISSALITNLLRHAVGKWQKGIKFAYYSCPVWHSPNVRAQSDLIAIGKLLRTGCSARLLWVPIEARIPTEMPSVTRMCLINTNTPRTLFWCLLHARIMPLPV